MNVIFRYGTILFLPVLLFCCKPLAAQDAFELSGSVNSSWNGAVAELIIYNEKKIILKTKVANGRFMLRGIATDQYHGCYLRFRKGIYTTGGYLFIAARTMRVDCSSDIASAKDFYGQCQFCNIPFIDLQIQYHKDTRHELEAVSQTGLQLTGNHSGQNSAQRDSLYAMLRIRRQELLNRQISFIKNHSASYPALVYFTNDVLDTDYISADSLRNLYQLLGRELQLTPRGQKADSLISRRQQIQTGRTAPDFFFADDRGVSRSLAAFRGKYVLLYFWASWCKPCIANIPVLRELHEKYSDNLQLIGISTDERPGAWLAAVHKHNLPWLHGRDSGNSGNDKGATRLYNVSYLPQYFLINPAGTIIYHNLCVNETDDYTILRQLAADSELKMKGVCGCETQSKCKLHYRNE
jgi:peroxiredoxin